MHNLIAFILLAMAAAIAFAAQVKLESYTIERRTLPSTVNAADVSGKRRSFNEVYIVRIKGQVPTFGANAVHLFIGEDLVREYGGTPDGIYFKIYDPALLQRWNGKPIRYALSPDKIQDSGLWFRTDQAVK